MRAPIDSIPLEPALQSFHQMLLLRVIYLSARAHSNPPLVIHARNCASVRARVALAYKHTHTYSTLSLFELKATM